MTEYSNPRVLALEEMLQSERLFEQSFKQFYPELCSFARSYVGDADDAEELVQQLFVKIWEKRNDLSIKTSLKSYLYSATRNSCLNFIEHQKVKGDYASYVKHHASPSHFAVDENMDLESLQERISSSLDKLPEKCREVFEMSRFESLKYQEIADKLGISVKTVENQMGKALKLLRVELKDYLPLIILLWSQGQLNFLWGI